METKIKKHNILSNEEVVKQLIKIGFTEEELIDITYDDIRNWLRDECKILVTVYPSFGEKIGYDTFTVSGFYYETAPYIDGGGIFIGWATYNEFWQSYKNITKKWKEVKDTILDDFKQEIYKTYDEALENGICEALKYFYQYANNSCCDLFEDNIVEERTEYPIYLAFRDNFGSWHTPLVFVSYNNDKTNNYHYNQPSYKSWDKDVNHNLNVEVLWDGQEFIVNNCKEKLLIGKQLYEITEKDLLNILYQDKQITKEELLEMWKEPSKYV